MKAQDVVILIKLHIWNKGRWKLVPLAASLNLSKSEVHNGIKRLARSGLYDEAFERARKSAMEEFFIHGLKYCFPAEVGAVQRGIPTAHSGPPLVDHIVSGGGEAYVWAHPKGKKRGASVSPLYKTAPDAALIDPRMHQYLALLDALRIGKAREQALAREELIKLIKTGNEYES